MPLLVSFHEHSRPSQTFSGRNGRRVLPNPSGLNAHYQLDALVEWFGELRAEFAG
jgi:hypothetical protein